MQQAAAEPLISVSELEKSYADVKALQGVSFSVQPGEVLGILGPNGSGKTTAIKSMLGLLTFDSGIVRVAGAEIPRQRRRVLGRMGAVLEGARNIYWYLSPRENLRYFAGIRGFALRRVQARMEHLLKRLGLTEVADKEVRKFSSGMKQKVALACALVHDPDILLLDEPTVGLDVEAAAEVRGMIADLAARRGRTILVTSHDMSFMEAVCSRVLIIREGSIVSGGSLEDLRRRFSSKIYQVTLASRPGDGCLAGIRKLAGLDVSECERGILLSLLPETPGAFHRTLDLLEESGLEPLDISTVESSLEEIFMDLVGRICD
jgi:ABC-2 type transport system ATP-binding protein